MTDINNALSKIEESLEYFIKGFNKLYEMGLTDYTYAFQEEELRKADDALELCKAIREQVPEGLSVALNNTNDIDYKLSADELDNYDALFFNVACLLQTICGGDDVN